MNNETNDKNTTPPENQINDPPLPTDPAPTVVAPASPIAPTSKPAGRWFTRKKFWIPALIILLLAAGATVWVLTHPGESMENTTKASAPSPASPQPKSISGATVVYSTPQPGTLVRPDCGSADHTLNAVSVADSKTSPTTKLDPGHGPDHFDAFGKKVILISYTDCGTTDNPKFWYSTDSGNSYTNFDVIKPSSKAIWNQVTSAMFSSDGATVIFANVADNKEGADSAVQDNTISEFNPETKAAKVLFKSEKRGVFIEGYDRAKQLVYYYTGCYNCDGSSRDVLYVRDIAKGTDSVVFDRTGSNGMGSVLNADFTKVLRMTGTAGEGMGYGSPYTITEYDIATKTTRTILGSTTTGTVPIFGYQKGTELPYYSLKEALYTVQANNQPAKICEATSAIAAVYHVDKNQCIFATGEYPSYTVSSYQISSKKTAKIFESNDKNRILGTAGIE